MTNHDIHLEIDAAVRNIEYCRLENITFEPNSASFQFRNGVWVADHHAFPVGDDHILDLMIIVTGNPGTTCQLSLKIGGGEAKTYAPYEPFSDNGRTFFSQKITVG